MTPCRHRHRSSACSTQAAYGCPAGALKRRWSRNSVQPIDTCDRSEEHTSELQSRLHLVCRLLLEKKKKHTPTISHTNADRHPSQHTPHHLPLSRLYSLAPTSSS